MPTLTDNPGAAALLDKLREEFGTFVLLNCKTNPKGVIDTFLDVSMEWDGHPDNEEWVRSAAASYFVSPAYYKPEQVAEELWALRDQAPSLDIEPFSEEVKFESTSILRTVGLGEGENPFLNKTIYPDLDEALSAKDVAAVLGRSYGYVKDHGKDLLGHKNDKGAWEFYPRLLATVYDTHKKP